MRKNIYRILLLLILTLFTVTIVGCDGKTPEKGYVSDTYIYVNIIYNFGDPGYTKYDCEGYFNYLAIEDELLPKELSRKARNINDNPLEHSSKCESYYLRLPLRITKTNWILYTEEGKYNTATSTKYFLESRCYQAAGGYLDKIYYYEREGGGFYLKAFGVNKPLKLKNPVEIEINAKWNIIAEYDENGYLISETFQTLNAYKAPDSESIYGKCTYKYY